jgi:S-adenosylmethionine decarboxylase
MHGVEWIIDAQGCDPAPLADLVRVRTLFERLVDALELHPVAAPTWHQFPHPGGITGLCLLAESHLACHTFPEHGALCLNVFCCRPRSDWDSTAVLTELFDATKVTVRRVHRTYQVATNP